MKNPIIIKSYQNGISVYLDPDLDYNLLLNEIETKFRETGNFFKNSKLALSLEGRELTEEEEHEIVNLICNTTDIQIVCLVGKNGTMEQSYLRALKQVDSYQKEKNAQFYRGTLRDGQTLETESSIIILGDVYPGSTIVSTRDIIIIGGLYGAAYAGGNGEDGHFIVALEMSPEKLKIGDTVYKNTGKAKWSIKAKAQPKIAYVQEDKLILEPITKELLNEII